MTVTINSNARSYGFPEDELENLVDAAQDSFIRNQQEYDHLKVWLEDEARWHIWKACDEMFQARDHAHNGDYGEATDHFADALNHMLFAMEIVEVNQND